MTKRDLSDRDAMERGSRPSPVSHVRAAHGAGLPDAVERLVAPFGGWKTIVSPGERVAVKVNLLRGAPPERAVSTHPETLRCVLRALRAAGADPFVADSPGGRNGPAKVARAYRISGMATVCAEEGVPIVDIEDAKTTVDSPNGKLYRSFTVGEPFVSADAIVQVGVLKTHQLMRLTGGVKLTYGCIPGLGKTQLHVRASRREDFADMLLDLHLAMAPRFTIIDGIIAMEGQGPGNGQPRELGSLFAARDCVALDAALADRAAHRRRDIYVLAAAERRGLVDLDDPYGLEGDPIEPALDFVPAGRDFQSRLPQSLQRVGRRLITARPRLVDPAACISCGDCATICGAEAIEVAPLPVFDDRRCVRCFACTEVCPTRAIDTVTPPLARWLARH
ncbi:MAG TPA: DUF362 domain-containing protein [Thermoleophilia bacterium]|nr:DUF362 domain-containing protein [Thermoleophilia bacterium]